LDGLVPRPVAPVLMTLVLLGGIIVTAYTYRLMLHRPRSPKDTGTPELDHGSAREEL
jgi:hypothetical protein